MESPREVPCEAGHYNLSTIIAVGNKVSSQRALQFGERANAIMEKFAVKEFVMNDRRLKSYGPVLTKRHFE